MGWWRRKAGEQAAAFRGSLCPCLCGAKPAMRGVVSWAMWCGLVWCGVVCCDGLAAQDWVRTKRCMNLVQAATMLCWVCSLALLVCMSLTRPPSVRLFVSGRSFVASRKLKKKFRTGEILGGMHGLT